MRRNLREIWVDFVKYELSPPTGKFRQCALYVGRVSTSNLVSVFLEAGAAWDSPGQVISRIEDRHSLLYSRSSTPLLCRGGVMLRYNKRQVGG